MASVRATYWPQAGAAVEEVHARRGHDALVEVRAAAVVPDVVGAEVERGDPEDLGPRELRLGHPDAGLRGGHDQRPGVGEPQGGGQVDRKAEVGRLQRRGLEPRRELALHGCQDRTSRAWFLIWRGWLIGLRRRGQDSRHRCTGREENAVRFRLGKLGASPVSPRSVLGMNAVVEW